MLNHIGGREALVLLARYFWPFIAGALLLVALLAWVAA